MKQTFRHKEGWRSRGNIRRPRQNHARVSAVARNSTQWNSQGMKTGRFAGNARPTIQSIAPAASSAPNQIQGEIRVITATLRAVRQRAKA